MQKICICAVDSHVQAYVLCNLQMYFVVQKYTFFLKKHFDFKIL